MFRKLSDCLSPNIHIYIIIIHTILTGYQDLRRILSNYFHEWEKLIFFLVLSTSAFPSCKVVLGLYYSPFTFNLPVTLVLTLDWNSLPYKPTAELLLCSAPWFYYLIFFSSCSHTISTAAHTAQLWNILSSFLHPRKRRRKEREDFISMSWYHALNVIHCANNCISMFISWCAFNCFTHSLIHMK